MALLNKGLRRSLKGLYDDVEALGERTAAITPVTTPDGSDAGTTQTLANALKAKLNQLIAALNAE